MAARRNPPRDCAASETMLFGGSAALLWLLGVAAPMLALIGTALSGDIGATDMLDSVPRSLGYGTLAASLALALGVVVLKLQAGRARWFPALLQALLSANMAVPGLILGAG